MNLEYQLCNILSDCSIVKKSCSVGSLDNFESIASHVPQGQSGKGLKAKVDIAVYPPTFKKYDRYAGKDIDEPPILAMDRPELVPCEKLKPIPRELNSLLPRNCRKLAWIYYIIICVFACAGTLCGSIHTVRSYDFCVWLECVLVSLISTMMFSEGLIIFLMALGFSAYNFIRWLVISDDLVSLLDRMYPNVDLSGPDENPIVNYVGELYNVLHIIIQKYYYLKIHSLSKLLCYGVLNQCCILKQGSPLQA